MAQGNDKHALFSASKAWLWAGYPGEPGCPGSVILAQRLPPEPQSAAAAEGTEAHAMLEAACKNDPQWAMAPVPAEMKSGVRIALGYLDKLKKHYPHLQAFSELQLDLTEDIGGKFDMLAYCPDTAQMWVIDFKYGKVPVNVRNNPQLLCYGLFAKKHFDLKLVNVNLVVIQPRDYSLSPGESPVKDWSCAPSMLDAWEEQILRAVAEARHEPPVLRPHATRCRRCRAAAICPILAPTLPELPLEVIQPKKPRGAPQPRPFLAWRRTGGEGPMEIKDPQKNVFASVLAQVAAALGGLPAIKAYVEQVEALSDELALTHGLELPGNKVVYTDPRAAWDADPKTIANKLWELGRISPADVLPVGLISITGAKDMLKAALARLPAGEATKAWEEFAKLTKRVPSGKKALVPLSDPRAPAALVDFDKELTASAQFSEVQGIEETGKL